MKSEDSGGCRAWVVDSLLVALLAASAGVSVAVLVGLPGAALGYASSSERDDESGGGEPVDVARCRMEAVTLITTARFISSAHRSPRDTGLDVQTNAVATPCAVRPWGRCVVQETLLCYEHRILSLPERASVIRN